VVVVPEGEGDEKAWRPAEGWDGIGFVDGGEKRHNAPIVIQGYVVIAVTSYRVLGLIGIYLC
jgi:hypothetical protein